MSGVPEQELESLFWNRSRSQKKWLRSLLFQGGTRWKDRSHNKWYATRKSLWTAGIEESNNMFCIAWKMTKTGTNKPCVHGRRRGAWGLGPPGFWNYWKKKIVFPISRIKTKFHHFCPPPGKNFGKIPFCPPPLEKNPSGAHACVNWMDCACLVHKICGCYNKRSLRIAKQRDNKGDIFEGAN